MSPRDHAIDVELLFYFRARQLAEKLRAFSHVAWLTIDQFRDVGSAMRRLRLGPDYQPHRPYEEAFEEIFQIHLDDTKETGLTIRPEGLVRAGDPDVSGYLVGRKAFEISFESTPTLGDLNDYLQMHDEAFFGYWKHSNGTHYFDSPIAVETREEALRVAKENGQQSVWEVESGAEIDVNDLEKKINDELCDRVRAVKTTDAKRRSD